MKSQNAQILSLMRSGPITNMHAFRLCGSFRLAARIHELRNMGIEIERRMIKQNGKRIAEYRLEGWEPSLTE